MGTQYSLYRTGNWNIAWELEHHLQDQKVIMIHAHFIHSIITFVEGFIGVEMIIFVRDLFSKTPNVFQRVQERQFIISIKILFHKMEYSKDIVKNVLVNYPALWISLKNLIIIRRQMHFDCCRSSLKNKVFEFHFNL